MGFVVPGQYNIEMLYILTFQVLSMFSAKLCFLLNVLFCPGFLTFWDKFQVISGPGQIIFKSAGCPGFKDVLGTLIKIQVYMCMWVEGRW